MAAADSFVPDDLVYWRGDVPEPSLEDLEETAAAQEVQGKNAYIEETAAAQKRYPSMYVSLCEDMIKTVLDGESFLFSDNELQFLATVCALPYNSRFLLFRLLFRRPDKWFRRDKLNYVKELGSIEEIEKALVGLCEACSPCVDALKKDKELPLEPSSSSAARHCWQTKQTEIIDLTLDEDDIEVKFEELGGFPNKVTSTPQCASDFLSRNEVVSSGCTSGIAKGKEKATDALQLFIQDERHATLEDLIACLNVEELKSMAKTLKISKVNLKRGNLMQALLSASSSQTTLQDFLLGGPRASPLSSPKISLSKKNGAAHRGRPLQHRQAPQSGVLRELVMKELKKCIRLSSAIYTIFRRLHIIFFRSTMLPVAILTPALLSRESYLAYEKALELEAEISALGDVYDALILGEESGNRIAPRKTKTPINEEDKENTGSNPVRIGDEGNLEGKDNMDDSRSSPCESKPESPAAKRRIYVAKGVLDIFRGAYPRWQELVKLVGEESGRDKGLERFDEGWVLTKVVFRGAEALADLKEYTREADLLEELLAQQRWWKGRRGKWYERLALIYMTHMGKKKREGQRRSKRDYLKKALDVVTRGLEDRYTHIIHRRALEARRFRLEKRLKIPEEKQHPYEDVMYEASKIYVQGTRIRYPSWTLTKEKSAPPAKQVSVLPFAPAKPRANSVDIPPKGSTAKGAIRGEDRTNSELVKEYKFGKSIWLGRNNEEVNVETLALQHYEEQGFKGFHSEGRIVHMIFGLLFWDIIFVAVPGAFETPYQSAPLDIADCFYQTREHEIEVRLADIYAGRGAEILGDAFDEHQPKGTWCIGVRWDTFEKQDLVEIVQCLGGHGLSQICRLLCEDYVGRSSGVPDLLVWNGETGDCKFVEVKGPGDRLQKNQEIWIDVLIRAGVSVEVCHVVDRADYIQIESVPRRRRWGGGSRKSKGVIQIEPETEDEDNDLDLDVDDEAAISPSDTDETRRTTKRQKTSPEVIDISEL